MTAVAAEFELRELLEAEGAVLGRGKRPRCPHCGRLGTLSVNFHRGVFCCHYAACSFRGNAHQLARAQGRLRQIPRAESQKQSQAYREAHQGAAWLAAQSQARRLELYEAHRSLFRILAGASIRLNTEPESEIAWSALAYAYRELPHVRVELAILEEASAATLLHFLTASEEECADQIGHVILAGGVTNWEGKFVNIDC
jgi:hypothetical protein